jgi:hypothetical protein
MQVDAKLEEVKDNAVTNIERDNDATLQTYMLFVFLGSYRK